MTIYVLHFEVKYHHVQHYTGWTKRLDPEVRITEHLKGTGSPLVKAVVAAGIRVFVADVFPGTRDDERRIKKNGGAQRICPFCQTAYNTRAREKMRRVRRKKKLPCTKFPSSANVSSSPEDGSSPTLNSSETPSIDSAPNDPSPS